MAGWGKRTWMNNNIGDEQQVLRALSLTLVLSMNLNLSMNDTQSGSEITYMMKMEIKTDKWFNFC